MADTQRPRNDLIALFPDNVIGLISPQDQRDYLKSVFLVDEAMVPLVGSSQNFGAVGTRWATGFLDDLDIANNIVVAGLVDGRDVSVDGTKLDTIETNADVTDETNVLAALAFSSANKDQGGGSITNVNLVDGRDVSADGIVLDAVATTYLRLDAANDPITGDLLLNENLLVKKQFAIGNTVTHTGNSVILGRHEVVVAGGGDAGLDFDFADIRQLSDGATSFAEAFRVIGRSKGTGATIVDLKAYESLAVMSGATNIDFMTAATGAVVTEVTGVGVVGTATGFDVFKLYNGSVPTNSHGHRIRSFGQSGIALAAGILMEDQTGAVLNYSLRSFGGQMVHAGNAHFGSTVDPTEALEVTGNALLNNVMAVGNTVVIDTARVINMNHVFAAGQLDPILCRFAATYDNNGINTDVIGIALVVSEVGSGGTNDIMQGMNLTLIHNSAFTTQTHMISLDCRIITFASGPVTRGTGIRTSLLGFSAIPVTSEGILIQNFGANTGTIAYGLRCLEQTGAISSLNIVSEGSTSKNIFEGFTSLGSASASSVPLTVTGNSIFNGDAQITGKTSIEAAMSWELDTFTTDTTVDDTHVSILLDGSSNSVRATLPTAVGIKGRVYFITSIDATNVTDILPDGTETINGSTGAFPLSVEETLTVQSDGSNWRVTA